jgi:hypothetical protein
MPSTEVTELVRIRAHRRPLADAILEYLGRVEALGVECQPGDIRAGGPTGIHMEFGGLPVGWIYPGWTKGRAQSLSRFEFHPADPHSLAAMFGDNVHAGEGNRPGRVNLQMEYRGHEDTEDAVAIMRLVVEERQAGRFPHGTGKDRWPAGSTPVRRQLGTPYEYRAPRVSSTQEAVPFEVDPNKVDRGRVAHEEVCRQLAACVEAIRLKPLRSEGEPDFDLAWMQRGKAIIAEVKSILPENEERQLRLGLGQVLRYRHQLQGRLPYDVIAVLAVETAPRDSSWIELCDSVGVRLVWPETMSQLMAHLGQPEVGPG